MKCGPRYTGLLGLGLGLEAKFSGLGLGLGLETSGVGLGLEAFGLGLVFLALALFKAKVITKMLTCYITSIGILQRFGVIFRPPSEP